jgi:hypothetical protein
MAKRPRVQSSDDEFDLDKRMSQEDFARLSGIIQQEVSRLLECGVLSPDGTGIEWMRYYIRFLQGQIFAKGCWQALNNFWSAPR